MPKPKRGPRTGSGPDHARHMLAGQAADLFVYGRIRTTRAKAKQLRPYAEKLITKAKRGDLHARRQVQAKLQDRAVVSWLFEDVAPRFADRPGGYTRVLKLGPRRGDDTEMAIIELVEQAEHPVDVGGGDEDGGGFMDRLRSRFSGSGDEGEPEDVPEQEPGDVAGEAADGEPAADAGAAEEPDGPPDAADGDADDENAG